MKEAVKYLQDTEVQYAMLKVKISHFGDHHTLIRYSKATAR